MPVYTPYVAATLNGVAIPGVQRGRVISSFTDPVTKIYVSCYPAIAWEEGDEIAVTMGSGTNNILSATGNVYSDSQSNAVGSSQELQARGPLFKAQKYTNNQTNGIKLVELTGGPATDEEIARAVLTVAGVPFVAVNIGGTGILRGALAPDAYTWREGETALAYLARLSRASLGYRMIEDIGGEVKRVQVFGRPQATPLFYLTQGVDIFGGARAVADTFGRYTAVTVSGYDYGGDQDPVRFSLPDPTPAGVDPFVYSSEMIERTLEADTGSGISAENIAVNFVEPEVNRISINVSGLRTPRDDVFGPGQTHQIDASLIGLEDEKLWLHTVVRECDKQWFVQTLDYVGGAEASGGYTGPGGPVGLFPAPQTIPLATPSITVTHTLALTPDPATIPLAIPDPTVTV